MVGRTLSWKLFFTHLVDNTVVGNRSLASCCSLDRFFFGGGGALDQWGQLCRCLQSSDAMKNPIELRQGKKLAQSILPLLLAFVPQLTLPHPGPTRCSCVGNHPRGEASQMTILLLGHFHGHCCATSDSRLCSLVWCLLTFFCSFLQNKHTCLHKYFRGLPYKES